MAQYCPGCSNGKLLPVEVEAIGSGPQSTIYCCPMCSQQREEIGKWFGGAEVRTVSTEQANKTQRKGNLMMAGLALGVGILGAIAENKNKDKT